MKNNDKTSKLSPLEELRQRKLILRQECQKDEERYIKVIDGLKDNWRSLLIGSVFSSSKSLVHSFFSSPKSGKSGMPAVGGGLIPKLIPMVWTVLQPILMKIVMNKIKGMFVRKNK